MKHIKLVVLVTFVAVFSGACSTGGAASPSASAAPASAPPASAPASEAASSSPAVGEHLAAIVAKGEITICSSPDFPPYESVDASGNFEGFDVDMMAEIAKRLNVKPVWQDMPFDVTITSLQAGKCDISVSTHQKTPDNSKQVDFTNEYEPATTVFMQRNDSDIVLKSVEDVAKYQVGVQTGGTNEKWLKDNLVAKGLMPEANLHTYERADASLLDLVNGRLDLITSEGNTGAFYAKSQPVKIGLITTKMNASNYVIAMQKGWTDLTEAFNQAIKAMQDDGTMKTLEEKWQLVEPPPGA